MTFNGSNAFVASTASFASPTTYSEEAWFKTATTAGGKLIGFGNAASGLSSSYDRHVYMQHNGTLTFGVWTGAENTVTSTDAYNDGHWHHVVGDPGAGGMTLYLDGELVGTHPQTQPRPTPASGGSAVTGSRRAPPALPPGSLDEAAVYPAVLSAARVAAALRRRRTAQKRPRPPSSPRSTDDLVLMLDASASADQDGEIAATRGTSVTARRRPARPRRTPTRRRGPTPLR